MASVSYSRPKVINNNSKRVTQEPFGSGILQFGALMGDFKPVGV